MIPIQNVYYMLSYAFQILMEQGYRSIETEHFDNVAELCASILCKGVSFQIKRGINREYIPKEEILAAAKGKIVISDSIKDQTILRKRLACKFDEFSADSYLNRIIKTTILYLIHSDISSIRKKELRKIIVYFSNVQTINIHKINWNQQYNRNNQTYQMLISICYLVVKGLLQTQSDGSLKIRDFFDEQRMCRLYEKFILEYFKKNYPELSANALQIPWQVDDGNKFLLPIMQTDICLSKDEKILIIDAKYYANIMQSKFDVLSINSNNLYQIFTYVKNKEAELHDIPHEVSGMLLYARTDEEIVPDNTYKMSGNKISVKTLDLNCDFQEIENQLNKIAFDFFGIIKADLEFRHG